MSDPSDDRLRQALATGADRWLPAAPLGATRTGLVGRARRRQRQVAAWAAVTTAVLLLVGATIAAGVGRPSGSSQQVAAEGQPGRPGGSGATVTSGPVGDGTTIAPGPPGGRATFPTPSPAATAPLGTRPATTVAPPPTATTSPPTSTTMTTTLSGGVSGVQGSVLFSPTCPVQRFPPDPACAPRPGPAHIDLIAGGSVAAQGNAGADGQFTIPVAAGAYTVVATSGTATAAPNIGRGCSVTPAQVTVAPGARATVSVSCDTGIR